METLSTSSENIVDGVFRALLDLGNFQKERIFKTSFAKIPLYKKLYRLCFLEKKLTFILPAFPAKSANHKKTSGVLPDLGEFIGLSNLNEFCSIVSSFYAPGAEVIICSDGRVFNDLVFVEDQSLDLYKDQIQEMIRVHKFSYLKTFDLDDLYKGENYNSMRIKLCSDFGHEEEKIREEVKLNRDSTNFFNGIHRFLKEDMLSLFPDLSRNQVCKKSKELAYKVIGRSRAWDRALAEAFEDTLRLSIHPYPIEHKKFGIKLVPSSNRWATPWHNVVLKTQLGFELVKKNEALSLGAVEKKWKGEYVYFE